MNKFNQHGASIIEVVIMSGVMVAMMTGFMSLVSHEAKNVAYLEDKLSRVALESELRMWFTNPDSCKDLLGGLTAPKENRTSDVTKALSKSLQWASLSKVFQRRENKIFYDKLEIKKISMENSDLTTSNSSGTMDVMFYPERNRKGGGPPNLQPIKIKTEVNVNGSYKIISCEPKGDKDEESCVIGDAIKGFPSTIHAWSCTEREGHDGVSYGYRLTAVNMTLKNHMVYVNGKPRSFSDSTYGLEIPSSRLIQTSAQWTFRTDHLSSETWQWSETWQCADGKLSPIGLGQPESTELLNAVLKGKSSATLPIPPPCK